MTKETKETTVEKKLIDLEKQYWQALKDRDVAACVRLTDFPVVVSGAQGIGRLDEKAFTAMMSGEQHYTLDDLELERDPKVRMISADVAIVAYKAHEKLTVDGKPVELDVADSSTWIRRDDRWTCAQHSEAIVGDPFGRDRKAQQTVR